MSRLAIALIVLVSWFPTNIYPSFGQSPADEPLIKEINDLALAGTKDIEREDYLDAVQSFSKASQLFDDYHMCDHHIHLPPTFYSNYGIALLRLGRTDEGLSQLLKAVSLPEVPAEIWEALADAYETKGMLAEAKRAFEKALESNPTKDQSVCFKATIKSIDQILAYGPASSQLDYFDEVTKKGLTRWKKMPIKVYIQPSFDSPYFKPEYVSIVKQAFNDWSQASGQFIKIDFLEKSESADIELNWTNNLKDLLSIVEAGQSTFITGPDGILKNKITILLHKDTPVKDVYFVLKDPPNMVTHVIYHEVGHALGLDGHSLDPNDVMYLFVSQQVKITDRDKRTIARIYSAPDRENVGSLNALGIRYATNGQEDEAIQKFKEAIKLSDMPNSYSSVVDNLIKAHYSLALKQIRQERFDDAELHLNEITQLAEQYNAPNLAQLLQTNENILVSIGKKDKAAELKQKLLIYNQKSDKENKQ